MQTERNPESTSSEDKAPRKRTGTVKVSPRLVRLAGTIISIWVMVILAGWFAIHRPFSVDMPVIPFSMEIVTAVGRTAADLLLLLAVSLGAGATGLRLLFLFRLEHKFNGLEKALLAFGLGFGAEIFLVLVLGVLGGLNLPVMYGLLALLILPNPRQCLWILKGWSTLGLRLWDWFVKAVWWEKLLGLYLGLTLVVPLLIGLGPVWSWDALMYHLAAPKLWVESGRIYSIFELPPASYPFGIEMLFTWAMVLRGDELAQVMHWLFMPLGGSVIWITGQRYFNLEPEKKRRALLFAVTLYFSVPHIQLLASWPYTDLLIAFYGLMGVHILLIGLEYPLSKSWGYVLLAAIFAGLAFSGKYTAVTVALAIFAAPVYYGMVTRRFGWARFWGWGVVYGLAALAVAVPWLVRNWAFTGNPIAPIFWGVNGWHPDEIAPIVGRDLGQTLSLEMVLGRPIKAATFGITGGAMDATITPLYLAFLPLAVLAAVRDKAVATFMFYIGVLYVTWIAIIVSTAQLDHSRILLPAFPFLALATGYGLVLLPSLKLGILRTFAPAALIIFLAGNALSLFLWFAAVDTLPYLGGFQSKNAYLDTILGSEMRVARFVNSLPENSYTFFLFEPRSYYFDRKVQPDLNGGELWYFVDNQPTPEKMRVELQRRGVTHVLIREFGFKFFRDNPQYMKPERVEAAEKLYEAFRSKYLEPVYREAEQYTVFTLK